jgi:predicted dehydrogenase
MATHRVGIIGLGTVGARFVEQFGDHPSFEVVAGWDLAESARSAFADRIRVVDTAEEVVDAADLVYIAVPPRAHAVYVELVVSAGRAIFCEKPLGTDVAESERIVALVESSGLPSAVNFVHGSAPASVEMGHRLAAHDDIESAHLELHFPEWPRAWQAGATWLAGSAEGGWTREVGSHYLFCARRMLGSLEVTASHTRRRSPEVAEDLVIAALEAGDVPLAFTGTSGSAGREVNGFTVRTASRSYRIIDWYRLQQTDGSGEWTDVDLDDGPAPNLTAYRAQVDQLAAMLDGRAHTLPTFSEALDVQRSVERIAGV